MSSESKSEGAKWRDFLAPLIGAAIILFQACTTYLQQSKNDSTEARLTRIETTNSYLESSQAILKRDYENFTKTLISIQNDVSYIRGKLEK